MYKQNKTIDKQNYRHVILIQVDITVYYVRGKRFFALQLMVHAKIFQKIIHYFYSLLDIASYLLLQYI